jgi:dUTP pyrophosphatase
MVVKLKVKKLHPNAKIPEYQTKGAAGFDISGIDDGESGGADELIENGGSKIFRTGLAFEIPEDHVMLVFSRSGMGFKNNLRLANCVGVIDEDYRGELLVKLTNDGMNDVSIQKDSRIAQGVILKLPEVEIEETDDLSETERGANGFGSTGKV